jgi:dipeptidyl aminopeptidase/acylaminoacyl peptidase
VIVAIPADVWAANFTLEQVMSSPFPSNLTAAAKSGRIAWVFNAKGASNVWVADAPDFAARQVTHFNDDDGQPLASLRITADGRTVVFARGSEASEAGRIADPTSSVSARKQKVWAVDVASGNARPLGDMGCAEEGCEDIQISPDGQFAVWAAKSQLWLAPVSGATPAQQLTELRGDNNSARWSPDGRSLAFVSDRGDHSFVGVYDFATGAVQFLAPSVDRDGSPRWSPDGKRLAFLRIPGEQPKAPLIPLQPVPWSIWVVEVASGKSVEVWHSGDKLDDSFPGLTGDASFLFANGQRIVFASEQDGRNHLYSVAAAGGNPVLLTPGAFDVEDVSLSADGASVLYTSNQDDVDRRHIWRVAIEGGKPQSLTHGETMEWTPVEVASGQAVVCLGSTATSPAMPYRVTAKGRQMIAASALPADFPSGQLVTPKQVIFKSEDGLELHGQLFESGAHDRPGPALVFMHGGPVRQMMLGFHYMDYCHNAYAMNQYLASRGYVVLSVNYRRGIMYGRAFREVADGGWRGSSEYKDVVAAGKYLQGLPEVDKSRIGLWGGSYGGLLTALGLARNSDMFAAGVDFHGVHDWSAFIKGQLNKLAPPDGEQALKLAFQSSPDASVEKWKSPVLLIHGDDDRNVPFSQSVELVQRLREQHVYFEELIFPDEVHGFLMWKSWIKAYGATAEFFDRKLKGK